MEHEEEEDQSCEQSSFYFHSFQLCYRSEALHADFVGGHRAFSRERMFDVGNEHVSGIGEAV
jgi:hypothetical protein